MPEPDQGVGLAGAGGPDDRQVLLCAYPFQAGQVVEHLAAGSRRRRRRTTSRVLVTGNAGGLESVDDVGGIPGGQLGFDQGAQHLFGGPALGLGGEQHFGCGAADRGQFQPAQPGVEIGGQRAGPTAVQRVWSA